jgi:hypothetical protein
MTDIIDTFNNAFEEPLGEDSPFPLMANCFRQMEIAEEEIAAAMKEHPEKSEMINATFPILNSPVMMDAPDELYRVHARQLIRNIVEEISPNRLTKAEVAVIISKGSMHTVPPAESLSLLAFSSPGVVDAMQAGMKAAGLETMEAYPVDPALYEHYWPLMEQWCRKIYDTINLEHRSKAYAKSLREYRK